MTVKIPNFSESIADESGKANHNWFNFWKTLPLTPGQLRGTTTNDDAAAGNVGEYVNSEITSGSPVALTTGVQMNVTSIPLTAGDWRVWFNGRFWPAAGTTITGAQFSISTVSATFQDSPHSRMSTLPVPNAGLLGGGAFALMSLNVGPTRISTAVSLTIYVVTYTAFSGGTLSAYGHLQAERRR